MARSTIEIEPTALVNVVTALQMAGIAIVGSKSRDGVVCLVVEGTFVPEAEQIRVSWTTAVGSVFSQITARCEIVEV